MRHFFVKSGYFLCSWSVFRWLQEGSSCVQGGLRRSGEAQSSRNAPGLLRLASSLPPFVSSSQPAAASLQLSDLDTPQKHRKRPDLTGKCLSQEVVPGFFQSSQATVQELWASPELLGPPGTQLDTSWSHLETPQKHRKRPDLTGKCLNQEVVIQASSRALRPPFWSSGLSLTSWDLLGRSSIPPGATWRRPRSTENNQT